MVPDDWQHEVLVDWLGIGKNGKWLARTCGLAVPRQNGKNGIVEVRELFGMIVLGEKFLHTAHEVKTARKAFKRLKHFFGDQVNDPNAKYPELNALVVEIRSTNGQEAIVLKNGGSVEFVARSKGSGRGFTVDVLVCDEAQDLTDEELEALLPTISAAPLGNPQIIFTGTPPNPDKNETGEVFLRVREDGEKGTDRALSWSDFGVEDGPLEGVDLDDTDMLYATNPALEAGRLQLEVCRTERRRLSPGGYARERLGWWGNRKATNTSLFGEGKWEAAELEPGDRPTPGAVGVAISIDRAWVSLGSCGPWDDGSYLIGSVNERRRHGDMVLIESEDEEPRRVPWIVVEAKRIQDAYGCAIVIDGRGPAADLIPTMQDEGVDVVTASTDDYLNACSNLFDAVGSGEATHMGDEELQTAVSVAVVRDVGDRWAWGRRKSMGDISVLEAVTLAWFGRDMGWTDIGDSVL